MKNHALYLVTLLLVAPASAVAQDAIITDRPDFTESTATVAPGRMQIESGYTMSRADGLNAHSIGELLLRIGVAERVELRLAANSYVIADADLPGDESVRGREDAAAGVKIQLVPEPLGARPALALLLATSLPTGSRAFRQDKLQPEAKLAASWDVSERVAMASNVNYARLRDERGWYGESSASLTAGISLAEALGSYVEVYGFAPASRPDQVIINGGVTWLLSSDLQLDARLGAVVSGSAERFIGIGIARRI